MAFKMLGAETDKNSQEVRDAFGEICNMVAGNFKNKISGLGEGCMLSVPTVVTGNDYSLHSLTDVATPRSTTPIRRQAPRHRAEKSVSPCSTS